MLVILLSAEHCVRCHSTKHFLLQNRRHAWRRINARDEEEKKKDNKINKEIGISKTAFPYPLNSNSL